MDGLALFCNLCADGPVTLRRLRSAGVRDLEQLAAAEPARLAALLHASLPQARSFAGEARRLAQRIGEAGRAPRGPAEAQASDAPGVPLAAPAASDERLVPGLLPGLDATVCARLAGAGVRTRRALAEGAGLALARRTGVPYSALLALARAARRPLAGPAAPVPDRPRSEELRVHELVPQRRSEAVRPPAAVPEPSHAEPFVLPLLEPESAGPFG